MNVSLRSLVAHVNIASLPSDIPAQSVLDAHMERVGKATIVSHQNIDRVPTVARTLSLSFSNNGVFNPVPVGEIKYLFRPVWDTAKQVVVTYLCQPSPRSCALPDANAMGLCSGENECDQA